MPTIFYATPVEFEFGASQLVGDRCRKLGISRPLVVTDAGVEAAGITEKVTRHLQGLPYVKTADVTTNPSEASVLSGLSLYRSEGCDGIVAIGGGSVIDTAKAIALLATNEGSVLEYSTHSGPPRHILTLPAPVIAVPTTAGTGCEVSRAAGISVGDDHTEVTIIDPLLFPRLALCDPELTLSLPSGLTATTAMDAFTHCMEAFISPVKNPPIEAIARDGLRRLYNNIEKVLLNPSDRTARWNVMMGALEGGMAIPKGLGPAHAVGIPLGKVGAHHGALVGVLMPKVIRWYGDFLGAKQEELAAILGLTNGPNLATALEDFNQRLGLPANLTALGVPPEILPSIGEDATRMRYHEICIKPTDAQGYTQLLRSAM